MKPKLFAFDLDGTLLNNKKELSKENIEALQEISSNGVTVALASGRIGSCMDQYAKKLHGNTAMLTLNGAAVYRSSTDISQPIYSSTLPSGYADYLIEYSKNKPFGMNYYLDNKLYALKEEHNAHWYDLYFKETRSEYNFISSYQDLLGKKPSKMLFIGEKRELDIQEEYFRSQWGDSVYICRTWEHYLEFLNVDANKGKGIEALANELGIRLSEVIAFGDALNDIPMLERVGLGIAMKNADIAVKKAARRITSFSNDENGIAQEWKILKAEFFPA